MSREKTLKNADSCGPLAERLKDLIGDQSLSEYAREVGLTYQDLQRYLRGAEPRASVVGALMARKNVNPNWLLLGEGPKFVEPKSTSEALAEAEASFRRPPEPPPLHEVLADVERRQRLPAEPKTIADAAAEVEGQMARACAVAESPSPYTTSAVAPVVQQALRLLQSGDYSVTITITPILRQSVPQNFTPGTPRKA